MCATCISNLNYQCYSFPRAIGSFEGTLTGSIFSAPSFGPILQLSRRRKLFQECSCLRSSCGKIFSVRRTTQAKPFNGQKKKTKHYKMLLAAGLLFVAIAVSGQVRAIYDIRDACNTVRPTLRRKSPLATMTSPLPPPPPPRLLRRITLTVGVAASAPRSRRSYSTNTLEHSHEIKYNRNNHQSVLAMN
jgi:hypothetical protein